MPKLFVGTSGWSYDHWRGAFYPENVPKSKWLEYYCQHFATVEINSSFYRLPRESTFENWGKRVPDGFVFAVKASRYITHIKKLTDPAQSTQLFLSRAKFLGDKLGPILFQLPPGLKVDLGRLEDTLKSLEPSFRYTFEFRYQSWFCDEVYDLLKRYNAALCIADSPDFPMVVKRTADFSYFRLHGSTELYASRYSPDELRTWAGRVEEYLREGADVYVYFDNDAYGYAVVNAKELISLLKV